MFPQIGVGGGIPTTRNPNAASMTMATAKRDPGHRDGDDHPKPETWDRQEEDGKHAGPGIRDIRHGSVILKPGRESCQAKRRLTGKLLKRERCMVSPRRIEAVASSGRSTSAMWGVPVTCPRSWSARTGSLLTRYRGMRRASGTIPAMGAWPVRSRWVHTETTQKRTSSRVALRTA
jgi:hypothetical protein